MAFIHHEKAGDYGPQNRNISPEISAFYSITWRDGKRYICQGLDVDEHDQMILLKFMALRDEFLASSKRHKLGAIQIHQAKRP